MRFSHYTCVNLDSEPLSDHMLAQLDAHAESLARADAAKQEARLDRAVYKKKAIKGGLTDPQRSKIAYNNNRQVRLLKAACDEQLRRLDAAELERISGQNSFSTKQGDAE